MMLPMPLRNVLFKDKIKTEKIRVKNRALNYLPEVSKEKEVVSPSKP